MALIYAIHIIYTYTNKIINIQEKNQKKMSITEYDERDDLLKYHQ